MNTVSKLIKGLILTVILVASFNINIEGKTVAKNSLAINFSNEAFAKTVGIGGVCGGTTGNECGSTGSCTDGFCNPKTDDQLMSEASTSGGSGTSDSSSGGSTSGTPKEVSLSQDTLQSIAKASQIIFKIFDPLVFFFTKNISNFLGTDLVFAGNMGKNLNAIWVISRNIVNVIFVLILLYLAVMQIFGSDEKSDLKKILPKFAIMLIAVNFSWLGSKLIVDVANVATNVVFAIPNGVKGLVTLPTAKTMKCEISPNGEKIINDSCMPASIWWVGDATKTINMSAKDCENGSKYTTTLADGKTIATYGAVKDGYGKAYKDTFSVTNDANGVANVNENVTQTDPTSPYYQTTTFCWNDLDIGKFDSSNAAYQLTYSMARVQNLGISQSDSLPKLAIGTIFALFIKVVYLCAFAGLFIALVVRMAMLWILVAFSPFIVLMMFSDIKILEKISGGEIKKYLSLDAFTKWAFAPVQIAAIWTVGYIMITTGQTATSDIFARLDSVGTVSGKVFQVSSIFMGMNSLQEMIWLIMTIGIIWMGTFSVLGGLDISKGATEWINKQGKAVGGLISSSPTWAPIIPTIDPGTGKLHMQSAGKYAPTEWAEGLKHKYKYGNTSSTSEEISKASIKFNKEDIKDLKEALKSKDYEAALTQLENKSGLDRTKIKEKFSEKTLKEFLDAHGDMDKNQSEDWSKKLYEQAKALPGTAKTPAATAAEPAKPDVTADAVEKGVKKGLADAGFTASDDVIKKAIAAAPQLADSEKTKLVVENLKKSTSVQKLPDTKPVDEKAAPSAK
jgi:hypothetical protein